MLLVLVLNTNLGLCIAASINIASSISGLTPGSQIFDSVGDSVVENHIIAKKSKSKQIHFGKSQVKVIK
jgi:hypothetical protein